MINDHNGLYPIEQNKNLLVHTNIHLQKKTKERHGGGDVFPCSKTSTCNRYFYLYGSNWFKQESSVLLKKMISTKYTPNSVLNPKGKIVALHRGSLADPTLTK